MGESGSFLILLAFLAPLILLVTFQRRTMRKQVQQVQSQLALGVEVLTASGVFGTVRALREDYVELEVAPGVVMKWVRASIARVIPPPDDEVSEGPTSTESSQP